MAKEKEIEIIIENDGTISAEQLGWEGKGCHGAIDDLIKELGKEVKNKKTQEYYKEEKVRIQNRLG